MIRAAYFDADGTLVSFASHTVPTDALEALRMLGARGVMRVLCTGRNADSSRALIASGLFDALILLNGGYCSLGGETVVSRPVAREDLETAVEGAAEGLWTLGFVGVNDSFMNRDDPFLRAAERRGGMPPTRFRDPRSAFDMEIYQMHYYGPPGGEEALLQRTKSLTSSRWAPDFADVYPDAAGKAQAMRALNERLGISAGECMAFGDGENDISLIEAAGIGVAMGNASERVKSRADYVTSGVDEGGIAGALRHFEGLL